MSTAAKIEEKRLDDEIPHRVNEFVSTFEKLIKDLRVGPKQILNLDETPLNSTTPMKTLSPKGSKKKNQVDYEQNKWGSCLPVIRADGKLILNALILPYENSSSNEKQVTISIPKMFRT